MAFYQKFEKKNNDGSKKDLYPKLKILADKIVNDEILSSRNTSVNSGPCFSACSKIFFNVFSDIYGY